MIVTFHCFFHTAKKLRSGAIVRFSDNSSSFVRPSTFMSKFGFLYISDSKEYETLHSNCP